ncbi:MAG: hypothetical protein KC503_29085 [Myxococcales bacterium]|nr:hypothetical protein [Myxococcales bacterium]
MSGEGTQDSAQIFATMKEFIDFGEQDVKNLVEMAPLMQKHQQRITDYFYEVLGKYPPTAKLIEGRIDQLKGTHAVWFGELFAGDYSDAYFEGRWRIGMAHVRIGLDPYWVEAVMSVIRTMSLEALAQELDDAAAVAQKHASLLKLLDIDLLIINLSYQEDRLARLTDFTGMKRKLIENIIRIPKKKD